MNCPNCGEFLSEEQLYCEKCGAEIHFVPDFEPEIEQSISETLSELQFMDEEGDFEDVEFIEEEIIEEEIIEEEYIEEEILDENFFDGEVIYEDMDETEEYEVYDEFDEEYDLNSYDDFDDFDEDGPVLQQIIKMIKESKAKWFIIASLCAVVLLVLVGIYRVGIGIYHDNSYTYQKELAQSFALEGDYLSAIEHMERALALNSEDSTLKYELADLYFKNGEDDKGILMLWEIIYEQGANYQSAYRKLIEYYANLGDYAMINEILQNCTDANVVSQFQNYMANPPEFSEVEGTYDEVVSLKLSSNSNGVIYYTIDGSVPTYDSPIYTDPITLDLGIYRVSAFFVNEYGIESEMISKTYTIDIRIPNPPNVLLESGDFDSPEMITVDVQQYCTVYYTIDGTMPTMESTEYTGPIPMPIGTSHFIFVAYSQEGLPGEVTECDYNLELNTNIQVADIIQNLMYYNFNTGRSMDIIGHLPGNTTTYDYVVSSAVAIDDVIYFIFVENMVDSSGHTMKTGTIYLADISTGSIFKAAKDEEGMYQVLDLVPPELCLPPVVSQNEVPVAPQDVTNP